MTFDRSMMGLVDPSGMAIGSPKPQPNLIAEERVNAELAESFDPLLFIRWIPTAYYNHHTQEFEGRYALLCWWPEADKRREWVQQGKHDPKEACDRLLWFCEDIHDAASLPKDPEAMRPLVFAALEAMDNTRYPWKDRLAQNMQKNLDVVTKRKAKVAELVEQAFEEVGGVKSLRRGKKTNDPQRLDYSGLEREMEEELESGDF